MPPSECTMDSGALTEEVREAMVCSILELMSFVMRVLAAASMAALELGRALKTKSALVRDRG